jgi:hypothetical protein
MIANLRIPSGWRTGYEGFECFPRLAFAWEYLRRNEMFYQACRTETRQVRQVGERLTMIDDPHVTSRGTCLFAASPDEDARSATVFWNPDRCPKVLRLLALPFQEGVKPFILREETLYTSVLVAADGTQHVLIRDGVRCLQLCVRGKSLLQPVTLVFDTGGSPSSPAFQMQMLACFQDCRAGKGLLERYFPPDPHAKRLTLVLRAFDGWLAGLPQREIALELYGPERVERDWRDPKENLRDQVRHAIARGRALADRGYSAFLR